MARRIRPAIARTTATARGKAAADSTARVETAGRVMHTVPLTPTDTDTTTGPRIVMAAPGPAVQGGPTALAAAWERVDLRVPAPWTWRQARASTDLGRTDLTSMDLTRVDLGSMDRASTDRVHRRRVVPGEARKARGQVPAAGDRPGRPDLAPRAITR